MSRLRNHLLACAAAIPLAAAAAWGAVGINDLQVTNVGTTTFTVVWTTSEVSTPGLEVFSDSGGANVVTAALSLDYYPVAEGDPTVVNDTGARAGRRALELLAISRRVVAVRVTGLVPGTAYFVRPRTFGPDGADNGASSVPLTPVTTAQFTSLVIDGRLAQVRFPAFAAEGMIAVVQGPAGTAPLSAIVGDSTAADSAVFPLAGLLDTATGTNALFNAPQSIAVRIFGLGAPASTFTKTINFGPAFTVAKYELVEADISSPAPFITTQPVNRAVQEGTAATFTAVATGTPAPIYQWQRKPAASATWSDLVEGSTYAGVTTGTLAVNHVTLAMTGDQFRSIASNGVPLDATSDAATLTVNTVVIAPSITNQPQSAAVAPGQNVSFTVVATGTPAPSYQWQRQANGTTGFVALADGGAYSGGSTATLTITGATVAMSGDQFQCVISNGTDTVVSTPVTVTVADNAPPGFGPPLPPAAQSVLPGGSVSFTINATGALPLSYQWFLNGSPIAGATSATYTIGSATAAEGGSYTVVISNSAGSITSPTCTLTILSEFHSADTNQDHQISIIELTRVIQLYNFINGATRTGEYHTQAGTEDGFSLGPGSIAAYHSADTNRDGRIDAPELLRVIVLYNFVNGTVRTGEYHAAAGTEDGFAPGSVGPL